MSRGAAGNADGELTPDSSGPRLGPGLTATLIGLATILLVRYVWGDWAPIPQFHDEAAYVLQAEIFADGQWKAAAPPEPQFFQQTHVLVDPVLAAKYPPGHSMVLAPGAWLGWVGMVPYLLAGLSGALIYLLAARVATPWVGLLTWWLWATSPQNLSWLASYFSELTTGALLLAGWWLLWRWRDRPGAGRLALVALAVGWGAITRPLTMLALSIPIAWVVLARMRERRAWGQLGVGVAVGTLVLLIWPLWSHSTVGSLDPTPHGMYTEQYMPWDRMGFGLEARPPTEPEPAEVTAIASQFVELHREHTAIRLPAILSQRLGHLIFPNGLDWRAVLVLSGLIGAIAHFRKAAFPLASAAALILAYALYAHPAHWTVYYMEILPVGAFLAALGVWRVARWLRPLASAEAAGRARVLVVGVAVGLLVHLSLSDTRRQMFVEALVRRNLMRFEACQTAVPRPAGLFVRHAEGHDPHRSYVRNVPDLRTAPIITALDRRSENARVAEALDDRPWFVVDEATWTVSPWPAGDAIDCFR